jgi:hypothetical protein
MAFWTFIGTFPKSSNFTTFWGMNGNERGMNGE